MNKKTTLVIIAIVVLLLALASTLLAGPWLWGLDGTIILQGIGGWLTAPMRVFTFLGEEMFFLILLPLVYWCLDKPLGADLGVLLVASGFVNGVLKSLIKHHRPFWQDPKLALASADSYSLPSGHAQNSTVVYGYLAMYLKNPWAILLVILALLVSLSRVYLAVHFPGDILWGIAIGLLLIVLYTWGKPRLLPRLRQLSLPADVGLALVAAAVVLGINLLGASVPLGTGAAYPQYNADAWRSTLNEAANLAGMVLGLWIGLAMEVRYVKFSVAGKWWQRVLRYVIGVAGLFAIWMGLRIIFPDDPLALDLALRVVRYALAMLWAILLWPWLFIRLGLGTGDTGENAALRLATFQS